MTTVFISYRRDDSEFVTDAIYEQMRQHFEDVFLDVGSIPSGVDFRKYLHERVASCDVMLVIIGPDWGRIMEERTSQYNDFVRIEVENALKLGKLVVPVLVKDTVMPDFSNLPASIRELQWRNAARIRRVPDLVDDCERLAKMIKDVIETQDNHPLQIAASSEAKPMFDASTVIGLASMGAHFYSQHQEKKKIPLLVTKSTGSNAPVRTIDLSMIASLQGHQGSISSLDFSVNGRYLASGAAGPNIALKNLFRKPERDYSVKIWDMNTHRLVKTFDKHVKPVKSLVFPPDPRWLISIGEDLVYLWNMENLSFASVVEDFAKKGVAVSDDHTILATSHLEDNTYELSLWRWGQNGYQVYHEQELEGRWMRTFSRDGRLLALIQRIDQEGENSDKRIKIHVLETNQGQKVAEYVEEFSKGWPTPNVFGTQFSPDNRFLLVILDDVLYGFDLNNHSELKRLGTLPSHGLWVSPDAQWLIGTRREHLWVWNVLGKTELEDYQLFGDSRSDPNVNPFGPRSRGELIRKDISIVVPPSQVIRSFKPHESKISDVAFSPDGTVLATAYHDYSIRLWNISTAIMQSSD